MIPEELELLRITEDNKIDYEIKADFHYIQMRNEEYFLNVTSTHADIENDVIKLEYIGGYKKIGRNIKTLSYGNIALPLLKTKGVIIKKGRKAIKSGIKNFGKCIEDLEIFR